MDNIWEVLGIEPTLDKDELKKAYRTMLVHVNPEDDAQGFMRLRKAYEAACRYADSGIIFQSKDIQGIREETIKSSILYKIREVYEDFYSRIQTYSWEKLLNRNEFNSEDTAEEAFYILMTYLQEHFYLPQRVWKVITDKFDIASRKMILCEVYPEKFINYMLEHSEMPDMINYDLFAGNTCEYDDFIEKFYRLENVIHNREIQKIKKYYENLESKDVYHPYVEIYRMRYEINEMHIENESEIAEQYDEKLIEFQNRVEYLLQDAEKDTFLINFCADIAMLRHDYEKSKKYYELSIELVPDNYVVKKKLGELYFLLGDYKASQTIYKDMLAINRYDRSVKSAFLRSANKLTELLRKSCEPASQNDSFMLELACNYCYLSKYNKAIDILNAYAGEKNFEYYDIKGTVYFNKCDYKNAIRSFNELKTQIEKLIVNDVSQKSKSDRKKFGYVNNMLASCYLKMKMPDEAEICLETALADEYESIIHSYELKCELEYIKEDYDRCIDECEKLLDKDIGNFAGYNYQAKAYYKIGYFEDALNACVNAIEICKYVASPYTVKVQIYLEFNQLENAKKVIAQYREYKLDSDSIDYAEALILKYEKKYSEVVKLLSKTVERDIPGNTDMDDYAELYMLLADGFEKTNVPSEAMNCYLQVVQMFPKHKKAYGQIAGLYREQRKYTDSIKLFTKQLEMEPSVYIFLSRGCLYEYLESDLNAENDYCDALDLEPKNYECNKRLGLLYERNNSFEKALTCYNSILSDMKIHTNKEAYERIFFYKARALQCLNRFNDSKDVYKQYIEIFGMNPEVICDYSVLLQRMNLINEALSVLSNCIDTVEYSEDVQACIIRLCEVYGAEGVLDKAKECFYKAISKDKNDAKAYAAIAGAFMLWNLYDDAKNAYENAVRLDIDGKENYYSELMEAVLLSNKLHLNIEIIIKRIFTQQTALLIPEEAQIYMRRGLRIRSDLESPEEFVKQARISRLDKSYKDARQLCEQAMKVKRCKGCLYGKCHKAIFELGRIYEAKHKFELAEKQYREALKICGHNAVYEERLKRIEGK